MCKELFVRSALFREHLITDLQLIYKLTAEINSKSKLPPPKSAAENLKALAVSTLIQWVDTYGETYKKLKVAYNYFKSTKKVDFQTLEVLNSNRCNTENERGSHKKLIREGKIKQLLDDIDSKSF